MSSSVRLSSLVCLSSVWCTLLRRLKFSAMFLRHRVPWPSTCIDIQVTFYEDRPRGTPPAGELIRRGVAEYILDLSTAISQKRCKIGGTLLLITNRKSYMGLVQYAGRGGSAGVSKDNLRGGSDQVKYLSIDAGVS